MYCTSLQAQEVSYSNFEKFNTENGLPQNHINRIEQDRDGFIWIGTPSGLARFDGNEFLIFDANEMQSHYLSTSNIGDLFVDEDNRLWIVHNNGKVDLMNPETFEVERDVPPIRKISKEQFLLRRNGTNSWIMGNRRKGEWFIEKDDHYLQFDDTNSTLKRIFQQIEGQAPLNYGFKLGTEGELWQIFRDSLVFSERGMAAKTSFQLPAGMNLDFSKITFSYLWNIDTKRLFFAGFKALHVLDKTTGDFRTQSIPEITHLWNKGILPVSGQGRQVNGNFIFAYQGYVFQLNPVSLTISVLWKSPQSEVFPISTLMLTNEKTLWVGVSGEGLFKVNLLTPEFKYVLYQDNFLSDVLRNEMGMTDSMLPENWIRKGGPYGLRTFNQDKDLYLTNERGFGDKRRVYQWSKEKISFFPIPGESPRVSFMGIHGFKNNTMAIDQDGWLFHWENPNEYPEIQHIIPIKNIQGRQNMQINDLVVDEDFQWVLTKYGQLIQFKDGDRMRTFEPGTGKSTFISLKQDPLEDSILWIGTLGDGLIKWNKSTQKTSKRYVKTDGMMDDRIAGIVFDTEKQIWLSTFNGIIKFNRVKDEFTNYAKSDGVLEMEFNRHHAFRLPNGRIAFGGSLGYTVFDPTFFEDDPYQPRANIAAMYLNDSDLLETEEAVYEGNSLNTLRNITLPHDNNLLTIALASSTYNNISSTYYRYKLSDYTNGWVNLGDQHIVRLGKLTPGKYLLTMNVSNSQGVWSKSEKQITLIVTPPPWLTWWAYLLYTMSIVVLAYVYWRSYRYKIIRQQEEAFNKREAKRLSEMDRMKTRFFSNITHEFRTPLTLILSPLEKYLEDLSLPDKTRKILKSNYENANKLLKLVNQLLDIAKLESGQMRSHKAKGELLGFVKENIDRFRETAENRDITLSFEATMAEGNFEFDQNNFEQIIQNLLSNAIKFTGSEGRIWVRLFLSGMKDGEQSTLTFEVEDNGIGIPKKSIENLFDRFYQVDDTATRPHEGTGIGLALVKELSELMGGQVVVASEPGKGANFTVTFPIVRLAVSEDVKKPQPLVFEVTQENVSVPELLILVVEDNDELRAFIMDSLAERYQIIGAKDGREALELVQLELPDVIISDVMMPYLNGYELCQKVKSDVRSMHIHVILLTAKASQSAREEGLEHGADEYLTKPFHSRELDLRLLNFKEKREALQQHLVSALLPGKSMEAVPKIDDQFVQRLIEEIDRHLKDTKLDVSLLAKELGMSKSTLNRKMRAIFNLPTNQFIGDYRLQQSTTYLQSGYTVAETAYHVGFDSPSYFAQCFKRHFQKSPSDFQKQPL